MNATPEKTDWRLIALAVTAGVLGAFQFGKASISLTMIREDLGVSLSVASLLISIFGFNGALLGFAIGSLARRKGVQRFAVAGLALGAVGGFAGSLAPSFGPLLASRGIEAAGFLCVQVSAPTLVASYSRLEDRWLSFGIWGAYMPFGQALIIALAPPVLAATGWRGLWLLNAALMACASLIVYLVLRGRPEAEPPVSRSAGKEGGSRLRLPRPPGDSLLLGATFSTYSFQWMAVSAFLPTLYLDKGISLAAVGPLTAIVLGVNVIGNLAGGVCARAGFPRWRVIGIASLIMGATGFLIFSSWLPFGPSYAAALVFCTVGGAIPSTVQLAVPELIDSLGDMAAANGTVVQMAQISSATAPLAIGVAVSATGSWLIVGVMLFGAALIGFAMSFRLRTVEIRRRIRRLRGDAPATEASSAGARSGP